MKCILIFLPVLLSAACSNQLNNADDKEKILALQQQERIAHFNKDAELFASEFADGLYMVNRGEVDTASIAAHKQKIQSYFNDVKFIKWDDVAAPIIQFSNDHSMAYAIIQKQVILETKDSTGYTVIDTTDYAWTSIYRKQNKEWKLVCNTSTNK